MTARLFAALEVYHDHEPRSAAMNMAIDEALLESAKRPLLRLYRWDHPALSFGYFGRYADVASHESERDLVRRWTGGGTVFHGDDLTYALVIPRHGLFHSPMSIYTAVHRAICDALMNVGKRAELAAAAGVIGADCFASPVQSDVLMDGKKVAGAAQRRTRHSLLQQGSIQRVDLDKDFGQRFATQLAENCNQRQLGAEILIRARPLAEQKYAAASWLNQR